MAAQLSSLIFYVWPDRRRQRRALRDMDDDQVGDLVAGILNSAAQLIPSQCDHVLKGYRGDGEEGEAEADGSWPQTDLRSETVVACAFSAISP